VVRTVIFCKDCVHNGHRVPGNLAGPSYVTDTTLCSTEPARVPHPINGIESHYVKCVNRNADFACRLFVIRPPSISRAEPKPSWNWSKVFGGPP
jgi:hypothetical protein